MWSQKGCNSYLWWFSESMNQCDFFMLKAHYLKSLLQQLGVKNW